MPNEVAVYGAGGFAREAAWLAEVCGFVVTCFIDDKEATWGSTLNDIPVMSLNDMASRFPEAGVVLGIGAPRTRERLAQKVSTMGLSFETLIHPRVERSRYIEIGTGTVICAGNILTTNITIGDQVQINLDCTVGHDVVMKNFATLAPGVHISGCVQVGHAAYIGTGAVIINGTPDEPIVIGDDAVVGAGACVTKSIPAGLTVVGIPARPLQR